ncbi:hypothetical protein ABPG72_012965 [Tetrahymena utriculariae]
MFEVILQLLLNQSYLNNLIDPNYRSQSVIINDVIDVGLHNNLVAFNYQANSTSFLNDIEAEYNKTYLVFLPYQLSTDNQLIQLNITNCENSELTNYDCLDFSQISKNYTLTLDVKKNLVSRIIFLVYRCQDVDIYKTTVPENCADPSNIDEIINDPFSAFQLKLYTSQYNITSQKIQTKFRNQVINLQGDQFVFTTQNVNKYQTTVKKGPIFQSDFSFSSPISYIPIIQNFDRKTFSEKNGLTLIMQFTFNLDKIVEEIQIQFPTITQLFLLNATQQQLF